MNKEIKRGDIYWVDWNPSRGSEQSGLRPALVIQNDVGNKYSSTTIISALTTTLQKPYPFTVKATAKESGLPKDSMINLSQIMTIDKTHLTKKCGELTEAKMAEVNEAIKASLGMKD
ncbi:MAG: type II toxin-antitoxin system PemK/MazF family toxin [Dehalococcoidales bacterium]